MDSVDQKLAIWITNLKVLRQRLDEIGFVRRMIDMEFMICVFNKIYDEYNGMVDCLETCPVSTGEDKWLLESSGSY